MLLPIHEALPALRAALAAHTCVVLQAPPGAGKTTVVPLALLDEPWLGGRSIIMLEPRRLAARAVAQRMAESLGETVGQRVGYRVRFEAQISRATRVEVVTEGILARRLHSDPTLTGVGLVICDEFHERNLQADLALALTRDAQRGLREDLRILVMSATLDATRIARLLDDAPVITSAGRCHPVTVSYLARDAEGDSALAAMQAVNRAGAACTGDILVFLPGSGEIRRAQRLLEGQAEWSEAIIAPLYGDLPHAAQERALRPDPQGRRKVVLATPIAETSLTIEGITTVIDSGWERTPYFDPVSGLSRLQTVRISRASAEQRAGRAGRLGPGHCYRLWSEATQRGLLAHSPPEIMTADLAALALDLAAWGVADANSLTWLDPPPAAAFAQARELLTELGALDQRGRLTDLGYAMAQLPAHPRLAHLMIAGHRRGHGGLACDLAALLSERDVLSNDPTRSADIHSRWHALQRYRQSGRAGAQAAGADPTTCARVAQAARQWRQLLRVPETDQADSPARAGALLALAYPERLAATRDQGSGRYRLLSGRGVRLPRADTLAKTEFLIAAQVDAGGGNGFSSQEGVIHLAAPLTRSDVEEVYSARLSDTARIAWDNATQAVISVTERRIGALALTQKPLAHPDPDRVAQALLEGIRALGLDALPWTLETRQWQARVLSLRLWETPAAWPDVSDAFLLDTLEDWLAPYLTGYTRRDHLARLDLLAALNNLCSWTTQQQLATLTPTHLHVPSGSRKQLQYFPDGSAPVLAVKLQELFGLADTPCVAAGRVPVMLHLLSPAQHPIQVTQDLRGFWDRTYPQVKKELKGRYPKHPWPDDPWQAVPTARAKPRGSGGRSVQ